MWLFSISIFYNVINCLALEGAINVFILFILFNMWVKECLLKPWYILCFVLAFYESYSLMTNLYLRLLLLSCQNKTLRHQNTMSSNDEKRNIVYISNLNNKCSLPNCIGNRSFHLGLHSRSAPARPKQVVGNFKRFESIQRDHWLLNRRKS